MISFRGLMGIWCRTQQFLRDFVTWQGTRIVGPAMATRVTCPILMITIHLGNGLMLDNINSSWPSEPIWCHKTWSTTMLVQVMACCLTAPTHYLNECWQIISEVLRHSPQGNLRWNTKDVYPWWEFENYSFKMIAASPRGKWVNWWYIILNMQC